MRHFLRNSSLATQLALLALTATSAGIVAAFLATSPRLFATPEAAAEHVQVLYLRLIVATLCAGAITFGLLLTALRRLNRPMEQVREQLDKLTAGQLETIQLKQLPNRDTAGIASSLDRLVTQLQLQKTQWQLQEQALAFRTATVDRLLEFSQTIQGAGKMDQVFVSLIYFLRTELGLAGLAILANDAEATPSTSVKAAYPDDLFKPECPLADTMEQAMCPCLRQNLPRCFKAEGTPVRCSIDASMRLDKSHSAYCIPFNVGGKVQLLVHMLLPPAQVWTEDRKQLAHTYVNTAHSALISMHMLAEAEKQSMTDGLTGLYNRRSLESLLQREVALCERHGHALSIVMIDMDKFKEINDEHGHAAGDHMLKSFADCVRITLRKTDLAFRYGGDEFVIALPQTPIAQAQAVVQKLRQAYASVDFTHAITQLSQQPTLSIGVAERSKANNILTLESLMSAADQALYDAKNSNRNCVKLYAPPKAA